MKNFELISFSGPDELARAVANEWLDEVDSANQSGKEHRVAVSGGRISQTFFKCGVEQARARGISLQRVHFFWADERCVPPTDSESNFRVANELLFAPLKIAAGQIHRIRGEDSPAAGANSAADEICRIAPLSSTGQPMLDLIFLGLGEDGHTASLFPGEPTTISAGPAVYLAVFNSPKPPPHRITLGFSAIAAARQVWMLASGIGKKTALDRSTSSEGNTPFGQVLKLRSHTRIFTDIC